MRRQSGTVLLCTALLIASATGMAAVQDGPIGYASLNGGTTGGKGGEVVTVTDYASLVEAVAGPEPRIVQVSGTILGERKKMIEVGSNKTIIGLGNDAKLRGFGLDISGWTDEVSDRLGGTCEVEHENDFERVRNVIVRNLTFVESTDDSVSIRCYTTNVWIDHNTFHRSNDGSVDVKRGADWITVSWNRFVETDKTMLLGHSDTNDNQDVGRLHVSYHHNWLQGSVQRHPRVRFGYAHVFNNLVEMPRSYFVGAGVGSSILVEANYIITDRHQLRVIKDFGGEEVKFSPSNLVSMVKGAKSFKVEVQGGRTIIDAQYQYSLDNAIELKSRVPKGAGAGNL